jgi:hypothetical protein
MTRTRTRLLLRVIHTVSDRDVINSMKLSTLHGGVCISIHLLFITACERRRFPTEQAAVQQLRAHHDAYRALAEDWLASGHKYLAWFGRSNGGQESYFWNDYRVTPSGESWEVMHPGERDYVVQSAKSFDETARICGASGEEVSKWHHRLDSLGADEIRRVSFLKNGTRLNYVEIGYFPVLPSYGFFFAPGNDRAAQEVLQSWAKRTQYPGQRVHALDDQWFYFEGHWGSASLPSSRVP